MVRQPASAARYTFILGPDIIGQFLHGIRTFRADDSRCFVILKKIYKLRGSCTVYRTLYTDSMYT